MSLSIIIESLDPRLAATASVNFKSLMINIKVMTNFGIELLTYGHVPGSNRDKTFVRIKALKLSRHMTLRKKKFYMSLKVIMFHSK